VAHRNVSRNGIAARNGRAAITAEQYGCRKYYVETRACRGLRRFAGEGVVASRVSPVIAAIADQLSAIAYVLMAPAGVCGGSGISIIVALCAALACWRGRAGKRASLFGLNRRACMFARVEDHRLRRRLCHLEAPNVISGIMLRWNDMAAVAALALLLALSISVFSIHYDGHQAASRAFHQDFALWNAFERCTYAPLCLRQLLAATNASMAKTQRRGMAGGASSAACRAHRCHQTLSLRGMPPLPRAMRVWRVKPALPPAADEGISMNCRRGWHRFAAA